MGVSVVIACIGLAALARSIRRLRIPPDADFFTTMRYIPLLLAIVLDLLDFGLDIFSAPIMWIALDRMGLYNLRNKATIEALIPAHQCHPDLYGSWFAARLFNLGSSPGRMKATIGPIDHARITLDVGRRDCHAATHSDRYGRSAPYRPSATTGPKGAMPMSLLET